jgi:hypothetical protein
MKHALSKGVILSAIITLLSACTTWRINNRGEINVGGVEVNKKEVCDPKRTSSCRVDM